MAEDFDPDDVEKFLPQIAGAIARVGLGAGKKALEVGAKAAGKAKDVAVAGAGKAKDVAVAGASKAKEVGSSAAQKLQESGTKIQEVKGKLEENKKVQNALAASQQIQQRQQMAEQQKLEQQNRAAEMARGAASTGSTIGKAVGVAKAQQTLDAYDRRKIQEAISPESNTIVIASKPGSAEGMSSIEQSNLHNQLLARLAKLGKRAPNMNMMTGIGRSKEWGDEHSITLSNVPHDLVDDVKELAHQFRQDSILHSPEGTTDALFAPPRGEATAGLRNPSLTQDTPSDFTQYPVGMNLTYSDYFEKAVLVKERKTPEAMRHKREYDAAYNKRPDQVKYREELNRERRRRGIYGSHDHMDVSHTQGHRLTLEPEHSNRARHFKDKGTLRVVKSLKDDLELLRNLMQGPLDGQDKKIAQAMVGMLEERHQDDEEEKQPLSRPLFGGGDIFA